MDCARACTVGRLFAEKRDAGEAAEGRFRRLEQTLMTRTHPSPQCQRPTRKASAEKTRDARSSVLKWPGAWASAGAGC
jgi:hypothetical protein